MFMVMLMKDYREVLRNKRKALGLSQYMLAKKAGISQSFVNEIECGKKSPSIDMFFKLCEVLEIRVFPDEE